MSESEVKKLRGLVEDLIFFIENQDNYVVHLTKEGIRKSSQAFIREELQKKVNWPITFNGLLKPDPASEWGN